MIRSITALILFCVLLQLLYACSNNPRRSVSSKENESKAPESVKKTSQPIEQSQVRGPIIDSHTLITPLDDSIKTALTIFDKVGIVKFCNKNAGPLGSPAFKATLRIKHILKDNFDFFANLSWNGVNLPGWGDREADRLEAEVRLGAKGIKIFKALGLGVRDAKGKLLHVDDSRLDPIFERAAKLNAIVAMHTGDPKAFFEPTTPDNERYDELSLAPDWSFYGKDYPSRAQLLRERDHVIAKHPKTTFLLIHLANNPEDIDYVTRLLKTYPNVYVDTTARVPEIGRHHIDKLRAFFIRFQDRILFGTDLAISMYGMQLGSVSAKPPTIDDAVEFYRAHYRFFESDKKQISHPTPIQGRWKINGIHLPREVLRKLYYDNAENLIFKRKMTSLSPTEHPTSIPAG
ncbi:MAG: amidohydrolase [Proteobacteria bacterium]|nr:amidohydrolase [Pseudomonadota bacterium]